jgi:acyl-CoA thioesterase
MNPENPRSVVEYMMDHDAFSKWLGIEILEIKEGSCKLRMKIREEMTNGFYVSHGGIIFSFADSALAFACNNRNNLSLAMDCNISFLKQVNVGDELTAEAKEIHNGKSTGVYSITVINQNNQQVALFKGTCFRTGKNLV